MAYRPDLIGLSPGIRYSALNQFAFALVVKANLNMHMNTSFISSYSMGFRCTVGVVGKYTADVWCFLMAVLPTSPVKWRRTTMVYRFMANILFYNQHSSTTAAAAVLARLMLL